MFNFQVDPADPLVAIAIAVENVFSVADGECEVQDMYRCSFGHQLLANWWRIKLMPVLVLTVF